MTGWLSPNPPKQAIFGNCLLSSCTSLRSLYLRCDQDAARPRQADRKTTYSDSPQSGQQPSDGTAVAGYPGIDQATDEIILGCCEQYNDQGGNLARSSALQAGYRVTTPGLMVSRFCGSGLDAVNTAAAKLMAGQADVIVAGGVEMLSLVSIFGSGGPMSSDVSFKDAVVQIPQGLSADLIATLHGYCRTDVDALGAASQDRANAAWANGWFNNSVVPIRNGGQEPVLASDELVRENVTTESLAKLSPAFEKNRREITATTSDFVIRKSQGFVTFITPEILPG